MSEIHYWGYRINNDKAEFFEKELKENRLRQGWGYSEDQDLGNHDKSLDDGARRNLPIYNNVKKGHYLIIPHMPTWNTVTIAQATDDFDKGYKFEIDEDLKDFGHIFPAKYVKHFNRHNSIVTSDIKSSFKCISRFWNMDHCADDINKIIESEGELLDENDILYGWQQAVNDAFDEEEFSKKIYENLIKNYNASEWEFVLREGFKMMLPDNVNVETTWNTEEKKHGSDLLIKIPGIFETTYVIAVQIKDYDGVVSEKIVDQINKADEYFKVDTEKNTDMKLIDKYIILTKVDRGGNQSLIEAAETHNVKLIFKNDLIKLLSQMAKAYLGNTVRYCEL
ncbi:MAG: hypothetical protein ACI4SF_05165 [Oscillospiraceae bacterium]